MQPRTWLGGLLIHLDECLGIVLCVWYEAGWGLPVWS